MPRKKRGNRKKEGQKEAKEDQRAKTSQEENNIATKDSKQNNEFGKNIAYKQNQTTLEKDNELTQLKLQVQAAREMKRKTTQKTENLNFEESTQPDKHTTQVIREKGVTQPETERETSKLDTEREATEPETEGSARQHVTKRNTTHADRERETTLPTSKRKTTHLVTKRQSTQVERERDATQIGKMKETLRPRSGQKDQTQTEKEGEEASKRPSEKRDTFKGDIEREVTQPETEMNECQHETQKATTQPDNKRESTQADRERDTTPPASKRDATQSETSKESTQADRERETSPPGSKRYTTQSDTKRGSTQADRERETSPPGSKRYTTHSDTKRGSTHADSERETPPPSSKRYNTQSDTKRGSTQADRERETSPPGSKRYTTQSDTKRGSTQADRERETSPPGSKRDATQSDTKRETTHADRERETPPPGSKRYTTQSDTKRGSTQVDSERETSPPGSKRYTTQSETKRGSTHADRERETPPPGSKRYTTQSDTKRGSTNADIERETSPPGSKRYTTQSDTKRGSTQADRERETSPPGSKRYTTQSDIKRETTQADRERDTSPPGSKRHTTQSDTKRETTQADRERETPPPGSKRYTTQSDTKRESTQADSERDTSPPASKRDRTQSDTTRESTQADSGREKMPPASKRDKTQSDIKRESVQADRDRERETTPPASKRDATQSDSKRGPTQANREKEKLPPASKSDRTQSDTKRETTQSDRDRETSPPASNRYTTQSDTQKVPTQADSERETSQSVQADRDRERETTPPASKIDTTQPDTKRGSTHANSERETSPPASKRDRTQSDTNRETTQAYRERETSPPASKRYTTQSDTNRETTQADRERETSTPGSKRDTTQSDTKRGSTQADSERETSPPASKRDRTQSDTKRKSAQADGERETTPPASKSNTKQPPDANTEKTQRYTKGHATPPNTYTDTRYPYTEKNTPQTERETAHSDSAPPYTEREQPHIHIIDEEDEHILDDNMFFFNSVFSDTPEETENRDTETPSDGRYFHFLIQPDIWNDLKPEIKIYKSGRQVSKLKGNWTKVLSENVSEFEKGCVLSFKWHNVRSPSSNRQFSSYLNAKAECKGNHCNGVFVFTIQNEPKDNEPVLVDCHITGYISHDYYEVNRRHVTGLTREQLGLDIQKDSPSKVYYNNLANSNKEQMSLGNYTSVPNPAVLRKIVSEQMRKENLHQNIIAELQVLKESYENENTQYIRDIGLDPFYVIMFSDEQINFLKTNSDEGFVDLYIDATGSVIQNIPDQKRPYLYTIVTKPKADLPGVSVADMISTQHTIPRIELFLATIKRAMYMTGRNSLKVRKIETDYSFPLIQACLHTFNNTSLKSYLVKCSNIINTGQIPNDMYVHHLCSSHMMNDFSRMMKKYKHVVKKPVRHFSLKSFAILQNATTLEEAQRVFKDVCIVFLNKYQNVNVENAKKSLRAQSTIEEETDNEIDVDRSLEELKEEEDVLDKTIKAASPFTVPFEKIAGEVKQMVADSKDKECGESNDLYCCEVIQCLVEKFVPILPLWSGIILSQVKFTDEEMSTRDSSAAIESWFKFIKNDVGLKGKLRPYKFVIGNKKAIHGRLMEHQFPGCRKKSTSSKSTKRKKETDAEINTSEEIWKKKQKPARYHNTPPTRRIPNPTGKSEEHINYPNVMRWGGKVQGTYLHNTCTIDNALTILHLHSKESSHFRQDVHSQHEELFKTLSTVFRLMDEQEYAAAKIVWLQHANVTVQRSTNLFGDEADLFVRYLDTMWRSYTRSICDLETCPRHIIDSREEQGVTIHTPNQVDSLQELVDVWLVNTSVCNSLEDDRLTSEDDDDENMSHRCSGTRRIVRHLRKISPILVIRVYEHAIQHRISVRSLLSRDIVTLEGNVYQLAGVTMHRQSHYCAIVRIAQHGFLWYDGLSGKLQPLPSSFDEWNPYYTYLCREL